MFTLSNHHPCKTVLLIQAARTMNVAWEARECVKLLPAAPWQVHELADYAQLVTTIINLLGDRELRTNSSPLL